MQMGVSMGAGMGAGAGVQDKQRSSGSCTSASQVSGRGTHLLGVSRVDDWLGRLGGSGGASLRDAGGGDGDGLGFGRHIGSDEVGLLKVEGSRYAMRWCWE